VVIGMTHRTQKFLIAAAIALLLSGCESMPSFERNKPAEVVVDDDALCRGKGYAAGSPDYIACRKDRDAANSRENRMERAHRNLAEDMLNSQSAKGPWQQ
jgi:hypothetical protein